MSYYSTTEGDSAYHRQERGYRLVERHFSRRGELRNANAQRHLYEGFNRRVLMLESGRSQIESITRSSPNEPISVYEATDLALHLNAYYLNLCGALDNLAWALQHEHEILPNIVETSRGRMQCTLFGKRFQASVKSKSLVLGNYLASRQTWYEELRELRDPGAHRIPLYAVPGVMQSTQLGRYNALQLEAADAGRTGDLKRMMKLQHEAYGLSRDEPLMSISLESGFRLVNASKQVIADYDAFLDVAESVSEFLLPSRLPQPSPTSG